MDSIRIFSVTLYMKDGRISYYNVTTPLDDIHARKVAEGFEKAHYIRANAQYPGILFAEISCSPV